MKIEEFKKLFFKEFRTNLFLSIGNSPKPIHRIEASRYYYHPNILRTLKIFEEIGLIETKKIGREKLVKLTEIGKEIKREFRKLFKCIEEE
jgi:predicted transcriptional regulator